ncbi:MAG: Phthalate 4,5-dioxygenase oxygenase subunit [Nitrospira sp.]|nr:Phthalate 4,5-dioxygenase oxygenase subunit [Nitrospira sp.]
MLSKADNQLITQVSPGTPMGDTLRRYWMPVLLSTELAEPDGAPVRVRLLGEDLIAFRDTEGRIGLVGNHCPHRGASLFFGRNEESGLRCVYHGWKFDITGQCVDMPNEPPESNFKHKIHHTAYPCQEAGGVIWTYMGPAEHQPPLPAYEWMRLQHGVTSYISKVWEDCNFLQALEGGIDSSHSSFLHRNFGNDETSGIQSYRSRSTSPRLELVYTPWGYTYASIRPIPDEQVNFIRVYQFAMPFQQQRAGGYGRGTLKRDIVQGHLWVPIDDNTTHVYNFFYPRDGQPIDRDLWRNYEKGAGRGDEAYIPGTLKLVANRDNDWLVDRAIQRTVNFSGIMGTNTQDFALQETMGRVYDRTREHLGSADAAIIAARRLLLRAIKDVQEGNNPIGTHGEANYIRPAEEVLAMNIPWPDYFKAEVVAPR